MSDAIISFQGVGKRFGQVKAVDNASFDIQRGEFFSLLGPSGCGKTTLLRMVAGFEIPDSGEILIDGEPMSESALTEGWERVRDFVMERQMTFFEATTLIALEYFVEPSVVPCGPPQVVPIFTL